MKNTCTNVYMFQAWLDLINDSHLDPHIVIDPTRTSRPISVPMDYCVDGFLTLQLTGRSLGYFSIDKSSGYIMMSSRFNRIEQQMEIPIESVVVVQSSCRKIVLGMPVKLQRIGDWTDKCKDGVIPVPSASKVKSKLRIVK